MKLGFNDKKQFYEKNRFLVNENCEHIEKCSLQVEQHYDQGQVHEINQELFFTNIDPRYLRDRF